MSIDTIAGLLGLPTDVSPAINGDEERKQILKLFEGFRYRFHMHDVFRDFCDLAACALSNTCDKSQAEEREARYMQTAKRYTPEELQTFSKILSHLTKALEAYGPYDVLGSVYQSLEINNKHNGQFFTPQEVSNFMGAITAGDIGTVLEERGFVTVCEPAVGAGSMVFGFCRAMTAQGYNFQTQMHVTATDIDLQCAQMAYIQMSLLGVSAVVHHGDTLSLKVYSTWITPFHVLGDWSRKLGWVGDEPKAKKGKKMNDNLFNAPEYLRRNYLPEVTQARKELEAMSVKPAPARAKSILKRLGKIGLDVGAAEETLDEYTCTKSGDKKQRATLFNRLIGNVDGLAEEYRSEWRGLYNGEPGDLQITHPCYQAWADFKATCDDSVRREYALVQMDSETYGSFESDALAIAERCSMTPKVEDGVILVVLNEEKFLELRRKCVQTGNWTPWVIQWKSNEEGKAA